MSRRYVVAGHTLDGRPSGASRRLVSILRALPPLLEPDEEVVVLHGRSTPTEWRAPGLDWRRTTLPARPTWRRALAELLRLGPTLRALDADVVDIGTLPLPRRLPCPAVLTIHDLRDLDPEVSRRSPVVARAFLRSAADRAAHVVTPSEFTAGRLREVVTSPPPITVVRPGVDASLFDESPRPHPRRRHFLHVGHVESRKNLGTLLSAYAACRRLSREPSLPSLCIAGADHGARRALERQAKALGITDEVHFVGVVDDDRLRELYAGATALVMPSRHEGFGMPVIEALAVGVPVLVADAGALPEAAGAVSEVLPARDVEAWARAMVGTALQASDAAAIAARKAHARAFSWDKAAAETLSIWRGASRS